MRDRELVEGARAIASDMQLPSGRQAKLARIIDRHLPWFEAARARGLGWDDVIEMLFVAGVTRNNGMRLTRGHLSSLVWRKLKKRPARAAQRPVAASRQLRASSADAGSDARTSCGAQDGKRSSRAAVTKRQTAQPSGRSATPTLPPITSPPTRRIRHDDVDASPGGPQANRSVAAAPDPAPSDKAERVLAFMRRSADIRRKADES